MLRRGLAVLLTAVGVTVSAGMGSAEATTSGYVLSPGSGVLYDDCRDIAVPYSLSLDAGTDSWDMTVTAYAPDGTQEASDFVYDDANPTTGAAQLQFCGGEDPGTYTIRATGETSDYDHDAIDRPFVLAPVTFSLRQPHSVTSIRRTFKRHVNLLTVKVSDERPNGYFPTKYASTRLQVLRAGSWRTVPRTAAQTSSQGWYVYRVAHVPRAIKVRAITLAGTDYDSSVSAGVRLR